MNYEWLFKFIVAWMLVGVAMKMLGSLGIIVLVIAAVYLFKNDIQTYFKIKSRTKIRSKKK